MRFGDDAVRMIELARRETTPFGSDLVETSDHYMAD
jgi:hypothetical protein